MKPLSKQSQLQRDIQKQNIFLNKAFDTHFTGTQVYCTHEVRAQTVPDHRAAEVRPSKAEHISSANRTLA